MDAPAAHITEPAILIRISQKYYDGISPDELYEYTRGNWNAHGKKRDKAEYAFAVYEGIVRQVYRIHRWFRAEARDPEQKIQDRWRFKGEVARDLQHYVGCSVKSYFKKGNQNPIKYENC
jgi:hypothetical protein